MSLLMRITLNEPQIDRLSELAENIGLVTLGSFVLPAVIENEFNILLLVVGLPLSVGFWIYSLWLLRTFSSPPSSLN